MYVIESAVHEGFSAGFGAHRVLDYEQTQDS